MCEFLLISFIGIFSVYFLAQRSYIFRQYLNAWANYRRTRIINIIDEGKPDRISKISRDFSNVHEGVGNSSNLMCISSVVKGLMEGFLHIIDHIFNFSLLICRSVANKQGVWIQNGNRVFAWNKWLVQDNFSLYNSNSCQCLTLQFLWEYATISFCLQSSDLVIENSASWQLGKIILCSDLLCCELLFSVPLCWDLRRYITLCCNPLHFVYSSVVLLFIK